MERIEEIRIKQAAWSEGWRKSPLWLRLIGGPKTHYVEDRRQRGQTYRMAWGELTLGWSGLGLKLGCYETAHLNVAFVLGQVFIRLPWLDGWFLKREKDGECPTYGFTTFEQSLHLNWGRRCKIIDAPWTTRMISWEFLAHDGRWLGRDQMERSWAPGVGVAPYRETHPYHYMLMSGDVQHVEATITRTRMVRGLYWFSDKGPISRFLRSIGPKWRTDSIDIEFSDEVGERAGSWKGGCVGCGYTMQPGERPVQTLRRMQLERRFS